MRSGAPDRGRAPFPRSVVMNRRETPTFPARLFARALKRRAEILQTRCDHETQTRICGSGRATVRRAFFFLFSACFPRRVCFAGSARLGAHLSTRASSRAKGTSRRRLNARASLDARFLRPPRALRLGGWVRFATHWLTRLFVTLPAAHSRMQPLSLRCRPPPSRKTSPPRWSCRTWYVREGFTRIKGLAGAIPRPVEP